MPDQEMYRHGVFDATSLACFVSSFLLEGLQKCSGVLFCGTLELSDETRRTAAVPFVVSRATAYIASVIAQSCVRGRNRESCLLLGALLCVVGAGLSFISNEDIWITGCWGIVFGSGIGFAFPESLKVSQKFHKSPLSTVFKSAAPCFSCILMPHLMQYLISNFGLSGCLLILSGIVLNAAPFIMLAIYKIPFYTWRPKWRIRRKYDMNSNENNPGGMAGIDNDAFESESNEPIETPVSDTQVENRNAIVAKEQSRSNLTNGTSTAFDQLSSKIYTVKPDFQGLSEVIRKLGRDPESLAEIKTSNASSDLFENSFSEEDVLYEVTSEIPRKTSKEVNIIKRCSLTQESVPEDTVSQSRKRTISQKHTADVNTSSTVADETKTSMTDVQSNDKCMDTHKETVCAVERRETVVPQAEASEPTDIQPKNELLQKSQQTLVNGFQKGFPLEIKVHVVECTFTADELQDSHAFHKGRKNGYRKHSNSLFASNYDNIDFSSPNILKKCAKSTSLSRYPSNPNPRMYLISEDEELRIENNNQSNHEVVTESVRRPSRVLKWLNALKKIFRPSCLVIIYSFVIYEITLITLLTIFDDLVTDAGVDGATAVGVLPAFGLGGIAGRLSLRYWGDRLFLESSHGTAALLFILDGIVVAGILWSPNLYWIGGFYAGLGFLEVGISTTVWNLVSEYIDEEVKSGLFSTCSLFCGICLLFVPYTIGLSRDDLGEYDGLLQITSGLSVLCALLCYVLPRFTSHSRHMRGS